MDSYLAAQDAVLPLPLFNGFQLVTSEKLKVATKKNQKTPVHPVFELCQTIWERAEQVTQALDQYLLSLKATALKYLNDELPIRKQKQNIQHFDDLLNRVKQGLEEPGGEELAAAIRERYRAALIDEFQDTDPVQYAIFHNLFRGGQGALFLIGDPKQAIYSFRGADIFTYMKASRHVDRIATLTTNWRSQPGLIQAVNTLFGAASNPFVYQDIAFHLASPSSDTEAEPLLIDGRPEPPLKLWFLGADQVEGVKGLIPKPQVQTLLRRAVAAEISRLLELASKQQALIGEMPLKASDIAILVRTNEEARRMQQDLAVLRIPAVLYSTEDVFDSHEAMEMERILTGIILSHREGLVRAALATDIMGRRGDDLAALLADEKLWEKAIVTFRGYFELWHEQGFMRMFRHLMLQEKVRSRLLSCPDGERRVTNVLHLSEILHQEAWERKLGPNELVKWLAEQRNPQLRRGQETQLRLESDENAVKVVTIHKSKGLEYPVVFCPFAWGSSRRKDDKSPFTFHDANHDWALTLDLGSPEREGNRVLAEKETLAENVRLLYVALTRAKKRCYLAWGRFNTAETSAPAYLFHHRGGAESLNPVAETAAAFKELDDSSMLERLREIERLSAGSVELAHLPPGPGKKVTGAMSEAGVLSCRKFHAAIDTSWRVSSFSSLVSDAAQTAELPDRDESDRPTSADVEAIDPALPGQKADIFSFPRGAKAGTLLHDILEHLDFTESDPRVMENLVAEKLNEYGFDPAWQGAVCAMLDRVLAVPLGINGEAFSLSSIAGGDRLNELEFYCALQPITPASLQKLFSRYLKNAPDLPRLPENFSPSPELQNVKPLLRRKTSNLC